MDLKLNKKKKEIQLLWQLRPKELTVCRILCAAFCFCMNEYQLSIRSRWANSKIYKYK